MKTKLEPRTNLSLLKTILVIIGLLISFGCGWLTKALNEGRTHYIRVNVDKDEFYHLQPGDNLSLPSKGDTTDLNYFHKGDDTGTLYKVVK